jgi:hypothetical protein
LRVLGVNAVSGKLWLCLVDDHGVTETEPFLLELRDGPQAGYAIAAFRNESVHALTALRPDRVVLLDMEPGGQIPKVADVRARFTAEALLASCALDAGVACVRLARPTLRTRLGLPRKGGLADHVSSIFDTPVGKHWRRKRDLAALTAQAEVVGR